MLVLGEKVHKSCVTTIVNQLEVMDLPDNQCQILCAALAESPFEDLQQDFRSYYLLDKYIKNSPAFKFVQPTKFRLGTDKKCSFQYVSIVDTLCTIITDPGIKREKPS